jgi:hypothetical protein
MANLESRSQLMIALRESFDFGTECGDATFVCDLLAPGPRDSENAAEDSPAHSRLLRQKVMSTHTREKRRRA